MAARGEAIVELHGVEKSYGGVHALRGVDLEIGPGEVLALLGQNGAGKSTLIGILSGRVVPDAGDIRLHGEPVRAISVAAARSAGIAVVYQELSLFETFRVYENLYFNDDAYYRRGMFLAGRARREGQELLESLFPRTRLSVDRMTGELSVAQRQLVEIARALHRDARLIVLDEPTASLSAREVEELFAVVSDLRASGTAFLFVTHKLNEAARLGDRLTVLRDGSVVMTEEVASELDLDRLATAVAGAGSRALSSGRVRERPSGDGGPRFEARAVRPASFEEVVSFSVERGEIVALAGLTGSGRSSLARALFGVDRPLSGEVRVDGEAIRPGDLASSVAAGIAYVPEDRRRQGLLLEMSVRDNLTLPELSRRIAAGWVGREGQRRRAGELVRDLAIRPTNPELAALSLSGGNQQKVAVGKWFALPNLRVLVLDEPTKGVDVGARAELYEVIRATSERGVSVVVVPSEPSEALELADRVLVLRDHRMAAEVSSDETDEAALSELMGQAIVTAG